MKSTRCKFICNTVSKRLLSYGDGKPNFAYDAQFHIVHSGSEENKRFFASSPGGNLTISTMREDTFEPGKSYYVDLTECPVSPEPDASED